MLFITLIEYASTALSVLCLPVNVLFLVLLYRERRHSPFCSTFFQLCRHLTIADILMMLFSSILFKFPIYGWVPTKFVWEIEPWSVIPVLGVNYFGHAQAIGVIGIALNRFTAVYTPSRHRSFWWKQAHINILLVLQWVLPLLSVFPLFFAEFTFVRNNYTGGILFYARDHTFHRIYFLGMAVLDGVVINAFVSVIYICIFVKVRKHVRVRKPQELALRLASSAFLIFVLYLALGVFSLLSAMAPPSDPWMYRTIWFIVNDLLCSTNAPILLAMNRPIRSAFFRMLGFSKDRVSRTTMLLNDARPSEAKVVK
ncbi:hypothetical protein L596_018893 [Steinernema carpocapsae]|uniref:G-protein coupled receptors family 1 profile domain-containing protein n=1 Tax=Steinernema carpocapsae TaxID=34508 RepID=A0A4U5N631_STECR|nr:hypothetical protein L596_018893 [Steinernema carpocapsae]